MGWKRFDRRRNNKESVVAAYLSDDGSAPMPQLQVHTRLEEDPFIIMSDWSRQSFRGFETRFSGTTSRLLGKYPRWLAPETEPKAR